MSNLPSDEITEVEVTAEPIAIGLPRSLAVLSQAELSAKLREWRKPTEAPNETAIPELKSSDG